MPIGTREEERATCFFVKTKPPMYSSRVLQCSTEAFMKWRMTVFNTQQLIRTISVDVAEGRETTR